MNIFKLLGLEKVDKPKRATGQAGKRATKKGDK